MIFANHPSKLFCNGTRAVEDSSAIAFAKSFYQGLGFGRNVTASFKLGRNQIDLTNLLGKDISTYAKEEKSENYCYRLS